MTKTISLRSCEEITVLNIYATFFKTGSGERLRRYLAKSATLEKIVVFGDLQWLKKVEPQIDTDLHKYKQSVQAWKAPI